MNISWKWLSELINLTNISPQELAIKLTLAGFEAETTTKTSKIDTILDVNISANRSDAINLMGITREISAILKQPLLRTSNQYNTQITYKRIDTNNNNYLYGYLTNIKIKPSPVWLQYKLQCHGIQSQNNLTDILKLIALKWGQYFEIFDMDKINNNVKFSLSKCLHSRHSTILSNNEEKIINIEADEKILNKFIHIDKDTQNISMQAWIVNESNYKEISSLLMRTKNNFCKQNKTQTSFDLLNAYSEAILLINHLCCGQIQKTIYITNPPIIYQPFILNENYINNILGFISELNSISIKNRKRIPKQEIIQILIYLNCQINNQDTNWKIQIPPYRSQDLIRSIDLIEEIGRMYGFDKFIDNVPPYNKIGFKSKEYFKINQIRNILRNIGLTESIHYSLVKMQANYLRIHNPLIEDYKYLRNNIINNIITANYNNIKQGNEPIEVFEIGRIFNKINNFYFENIHVAGLLGGKEQYRSEWSKKPTVLTWFQAKGDLEELFERLQINITWKKPKENYLLLKKIKYFFHPNRIASLYIKEQPIGLFGQLDLKISKEFNIPEYTYGFEIELNYLIKATNKHSYCFKNYSKYPYVIRDITISTTKLIEVETLLNTLKNKLNPLVESISVFDCYSIKKNNNTTNNLGLRVKYRSTINTLTNEIVDNLNKKVEFLIREYL
uniref:phenylalanine--tRNA ligase n=1 Tax=Batrachospermum sp. TaxID=31373 RepID=A0A8K1YV04_9FLOR|nr:phenylalanyl-tRNA synthetase beta subunit [Batrachospermum sp.]